MSRTTESTTPNGALPSCLHSVFALLLRAHDYARELQCDPWEFAMELANFLAQGVTTSDLRYLLRKGLIEHGLEITHPEGRERSFRPEKSLALGERTCFVLTSQGVDQARRAGQVPVVGRKSPSHHGTSMAPKPASGPTPCWDSVLRELRLGERLVKQYKLPAPNQEAILAAFEEEGWPRRIDDPIPGNAGHDSRDRFRDAIKKLNRHQVQHLIQFQGDGSSTGVRWCLLSVDDLPERT